MLLLPLVATASAVDFHALRLVDPQGAPYPCATVETVHGVVFHTDAQGWSAVNEPGLMGQTVWLEPDGPFDVPADWLGLQGMQVDLDAGDTTVIELARTGPDAPCSTGDAQARLIAHGVPEPAEHHTLQVIDGETGRPVPAVGLRALDQERWTDNGGHVAWFDLDTMGQTVPFTVSSHGYTHATGTVDVVTTPGATTTITVDRRLPAERLVRLTGAGTWAETVMLGLPSPAAQPLLSGGVVGQDTMHAVPWRGELFALWGDTQRASYPLGNFYAAGASAPLDPTPEDGLDYTYLEASDGFTRPIAPSYGSGFPTWLSGLVALDDDELWATFVSVGSDFAIQTSGMVRWDDASGAFVEVFQWRPEHVARADNPALRVSMADGEHVVFRNQVRVVATPQALGDPDAYEAWTPLQADGSGWSVATLADGTPDWQWRRDAPPITREMVEDGQVPEEVSPWHRALEPDTGETPALHFGSIAWNPWRGRWTQVFTESWGATSLIGEIWYAEGDTPLGPWVWARHVITHDDYSFYNTYQHPWFADRGHRRILFEGTYTQWLGVGPRTPRHDYNQMLYGLDLDREEMVLPVAFYEVGGVPLPRRAVSTDAPVAFGALDRPDAEAVPVYWTAPDCDPSRTLSTTGPGEVALWGRPLGTPGLVDLLGEADTPLVAVWPSRWIGTVPLASSPLPELADAGPDQCDVASPVVLSGAASILADGIDTATWRWDGGEATGLDVTLDLPPGLHAVELEVEGPSGAAHDTVAVRVADPADPTTPGTTPTTGPTSPTDPAGPGPEGGSADPAGCGCQAGGGAGRLALATLTLAAFARGRRPRRPEPCGPSGA